MFQVDQQVKVTDQRPSAIGVVKQVSTWDKVTGLGEDNPCYLIFCTTWDVANGGGARWIDEVFSEAMNAN